MEIKQEELSHETPNSLKRAADSLESSPKRVKNEGDFQVHLPETEDLPKPEIPEHYPDVPRGKMALGLPLNDTGDEYLLEIDEQGETKIDRNGKLLGGRLFRLPTFTVLNRGNRQFMLATQVARMLTLRDSHNLFTKFPMLVKIALSPEEKTDLIDRKVLPLSYRSRPVNIVSAHGVFMVFGSRMIFNGRKVTDDYYEMAAIARGDVKDLPAYIDPRYGPATEQPENPPPVESIASTIDLNKKFLVKSNLTKTMVTEENWMLTHCLALKQLDYDTSYDRRQLWNGNFWDPYTGVRFYPGSSQPKNATWLRLMVQDGENLREPIYVKNDPKSGRLGYRTHMTSRNLVRRTGLAEVSAEIYEDVVLEEIKQAILEQQRLERAV